MVWTRPILGGGRERQVHFTTITRGNAVVTSSTQEIVTDMSTYTNTYLFTAWGFDAGSDYWAYGPGFGSIADPNYVDNRGQTRLIDSCYFMDKNDGPSDPNEGQIQLDSLFFHLDGISIPNDNLTVSKVVINGDEFPREWDGGSASYVPSSDGGTLFWWEEKDDGFGVGQNVWPWNNLSSSNPFVAGSNDIEVWVAR
jgi:hypothetical protein